MAISANFPTIKPSLLLDFANTEALDPRITFTRTTTAVYYNGVTTAKAEENLLPFSQQFEQTIGGWSHIFVTVAANTGDTTAPDGTSTAEKITANAVTNVHAVDGSNQPATINGAQYAYSVFAKKGTLNFIQLYVTADGTTHANFDLDTGVVGTTGGTVTAAITNVGNGWYRCSMIFTAGGTDRRIGIALVNSSSATRRLSWNASGTEDVYLWGAQAEQRNAVTAYTPTTTQPITNYIPVLQTAPAGVARFDHNPTTGESLGLLIEEQRTNLVLRSEDFSATWTTGGSSVLTNAIVAPDGTLTADRIIADTTSNFHGINQSIAVVTGTSYTFSVYAKPNGNNFLRVGFSGARFGTAIAYFDVATGVLGTIIGGTAVILSVGNGWYRCSFTAICTSTGTSSHSLIYTSQSNNQSQYTGDGYSGIYIWGAQLEAGTFPTSYIPTTSATVTRNADAATMTGANFSSWYSVDNVGTVYVEANETFVGNSSGPWWLNAGVLARGIAYRRITTSNTLELNYRQPDGTFRATTVSGAIPPGQYNKVAAAFNASTSSVSVNGASATTSTSNNLYPSVDQLRIGFAQVAGSAPFVWCGTIKKLSYYPKALTAAELQGLTT